MSKQYEIKITAAVLIDGQLVTPGKIVTVDEALAIQLLNRGRCELATEHDAPIDPASDYVEIMVAEPVAEEPKGKRARKGKAE